MRAYLADYELVAPRTLTEALSLIEAEPGAWRPIAGGTDLMVLFEAGRLPYRKLFSIWRLAELQGIAVSAEAVTLGALTTYTALREHPLLRAEFPMLCQAAAWTGGIANQNRGTLGGNIVNASPAADSPPALLVYDAELELASAHDTRRVPYASFHTGYKTTIMRANELLTRIRLPRPRGPRRQYTRKVGTRLAQAISKVAIAALADVRERTIADVRIAMGSVAPTPLRCVTTEAALHGRVVNERVIDEAVQALNRELSVIDDIRSSSNYRRRVAGNLLREFLEGLT